ncbi:MAG: DUF3990 domain-containing protein [Eggerthellaceae bacterium]|nr:DUF3990 domain-containing protein [Eggerthellaceae bacterium]
MYLFHGSYLEVARPRVDVSARLLDFGSGFYTTTDYEQARRFTERFPRRSKDRIINTYDFHEEPAKEALSIKTFTSADIRWLEYVVANRLGTAQKNDFDLVVGPVANDRVYDVVEAFELGDYTQDEAIRRLLAFKLTDQVVFKTDKSLDYLAFLSSESV